MPIYLNMKHQKIYAQTGEFVLLENGQPKLIGFVKDGQHYVSSGCIIPLKIVLHFGTKNFDRFYFENNTLVYNDVSPLREDFIREKYLELAKQKQLSPEEFIKEAVDCYTIKKLGF